jgi:hypothetical protein
MLADEKALSVVLGKNVQRQPAPESISDPKASCRYLRDEADVELGLREMYLSIASELDIALLEARCPKGFSPFAGRIRELI